MSDKQVSKLDTAFIVLRILAVFFLVFMLGMRIGYEKAHTLYKDDYKRGLEAGEKIWRH